MTLPIGVTLLVLATAVLHAVTQALIKAADDRLATRALVSIVSGVCFLPVLPFAGSLGPAALPWLLASTVTHVVYHFAMIGAYRHGDFAQVYPIARGLAPVLVAVLAFAVAGESLAACHLAGVLLVSGGIVLAAFSGGGIPGGERRAVVYAVLTGAVIATYTLFDGMGVRASTTALAYIAWFFVLDGCAMALALVALRRGNLSAAVRKAWRPGVAGGLMAVLIFGITLWALRLGGLAPVAALRETSVIFAALIGTYFFAEPFGRTRIAAAAAVAAGVLMMNLPG